MNFWLASLLFSFAARGADCSSALAPDWSDRPEDFPSIRRAWDEFKFSDPRKHDRRNFTYVVRMARGVRPTREGFEQWHRTSLDSGVMAASIVSNEFPRPIDGADWGVVLDIPGDAIQLTAPYDLHSNRWRRCPVDRFEMHTPQALLFESLCGFMETDRRSARPRGAGTCCADDALFSTYNEVVLSGDRQRDVKNIALIYVPNQSAIIPRQPFGSEKVRALGRELELPVIKICHRRSRFENARNKEFWELRSKIRRASRSKID